MTSEIYGGNIHSLHAVVNAITHIHIKPPRLTKERFVAWGAAAEAVAGGVVLGIRLGFNHHTPKQAAVLLAFHQQATNQVGGDQLGGAGEEGFGERWGGLGGRGGYGSGLDDEDNFNRENPASAKTHKLFSTDSRNREAQKHWQRREERAEHCQQTYNRD